MQSIENKYAQLLVDYCLFLKKGESLYISSTILAEALVKEVYREAVKRGVMVEVSLGFSEMNKIYLDNADDDLLAKPNNVKAYIISNFDAYLAIRAPYNLREDQNIDPKKAAKRGAANAHINKTYFERTANGSLKRSLCQYPTHASAQEAGMSLEEYRDFVFNACKLNEEDPKAAWERVGINQQKVVDFLNKSSQIRYVGKKTDVSFSVAGRTWINSDGKTNMPSGEVFTGPVEDSVNGHVYFDYPSIYRGNEVQGITLTIENGEVVKWEAQKGQEFLDQIMKIKGANFFGEVAIGTNYNIKRATKNILFDEKIGGTIHMAIGQSYKQTGGTNESNIHWDMISEMQDGGEIFADGKLIYKDGYFLGDLVI